MIRAGDIYRCEGRCRCGAIDVVLVLTAPPGVAPVRACQCAFCLTHGAETVCDPAGHVVIEVASDSGARFEGGGPDVWTLHCGGCDAVIGAVIEHQGTARCALNVRALAMRDFDDVDGVPVHDLQEPPAKKRRRRVQSYTPAEFKGIEWPWRRE